MKKVAFFTFAMFFAFGLSAQLKQANDAFEHHHYDTAIELYNKAIRKDLDNDKAITNLAICYWKTDQNKLAEYWFNRAAYMNDDPIVKLWYSQLLISNEKYEAAAKWLEKYMKSETDQDRTARAEKLAEYCEALLLGINLDDACEVSPLDVNSVHLDFAPTIRGNKLVFVTNREGVEERGGELDPWTSSRFTDVVSCVFDDELGVGPVAFEEAMPRTPHHEGPVCFSKDGMEMYLTVSDFDEKKRKFDNERNTRVTIVRYLWENNTWVSQGKLPFYSSDYNLAHPALSPDGNTLIFASDMPGSFGGMDLFVSHRESKGEWSIPEVLSEEVNTSGNELFPSFDAAGTLYFSSDLHIGLGGLDLFSSQWIEGSWSAAKNLGAPLNSPKDDFGICWVEEGKKGFFSSNRDSEQADDVLRFNYFDGIRVEGVVLDCATGSPIAGAPMELVYAETSKVVYTKANGEFSVLVPKCDLISLSASMEGYGVSESCANEQSFEVSSMEMGDVLQVTASLSRSTSGLVQQHYLKGLTLEMPYGLPVAGVSLEVIGNGETLELESNEWGAFVVGLEANTEYEIIAHLNEEVSESKSVFISEDELLTSMDIELWPNGTTVMANNQLHPEMKVFSGQVIQLYHIYFDKNKVKLEEDALADLDVLFELLQKYPAMTGEIMAHADARASHDYNLKLSQKRAEAAVDYLVKKGIDPARLIATGYGETMPKTRCENTADCTEEQHARNRRVEFRVIDEPESIDALSRESERFSAN